MESTPIIWRIHTQEIWVFMLFMLLALIYLLNRSLNPSLHQQRLLSAIAPSLPNRFEEADLAKPVVQDVLAFIFNSLILALTVFFFIPLPEFQSVQGSFHVFVLIVFIIGFIYFSKYCLYYLLVNSLDLGQFRFVLLQQILWLQYVASAVISMVLMLWYYQYLPEIRLVLLYVIGLLLLVAAIYRMYKIFLYMFHFRTFSPFYIILYLCGLELMPFLLSIWLIRGI